MRGVSTLRAKALAFAPSRASASDKPTRSNAFAFMCVGAFLSLPLAFLVAVALADAAHEPSALWSVASFLIVTIV